MINNMERKHGLNACNFSNIEFKNIKIPIENVLGEVGNGFKVAIDTLNAGNFCVGSVCGLMKRIMKDVTHHVITREQFGKPLMDFGLIQKRLSLMAASIYNLESALYFTAGILDNYHQPDASVELAMLKLFASEAAFKFVHDASQIMGSQVVLYSFFFLQSI